MSETKSQESIPDFNAELQAAIDRPLRADDIDSYAETALHQLIEVTDNVINAYQIANKDGEKNHSHIEIEDSAFQYFGLSGIGEILDHIEQKAEEIRALDSIIGKAHKISSVITPPDSHSGKPIVLGEASYEKKLTIPKLKTVLFVLNNDFGVDISDGAQLSITVGEVDPAMLRENSYYLVRAHNIERSILVCDEENNITYVFDSELLAKEGINEDLLLRMTKIQLDDLIKQNSSIGQRITYSGSFVPNIVKAIEEPKLANQKSRRSDDDIGRYLVPAAPEGVLSLGRVGEAINVPTSSVIEKVVNELGDSLGPIHRYRFGPRTAIGYNPEQQEQIRQYLEQQGYFNVAPEGFLNQNNLFRNWGVSHPLVGKAIAELGDSLGSVGLYRAPAGITAFYSPEQQQLIRSRLDQMGLLIPKAPEGYLSLNGLAKAMGVDNSTIGTVVEELGDQLGEVNRFKFGTVHAVGYSPEQQNFILKQLEQKGLVLDIAPEGVLSMAGIARSLGFGGDKSIKRAIEDLRDVLGEPKRYRFGIRKQMAYGYSPEQQTIITDYLRERGMLETPLEGYSNITDLSREFGTTTTQVRIVINSLGTELGEPRHFRAAPGSVAYYSPHQRELLGNELKRAGYVNNDPPEDYLTITGISKKLGRNQDTLEKAIVAIGEDLGEVRLYKFKTLVTKGYSPQQQKMLDAYFSQKPIKNP